jgi:serine protease AprX
LAADFGKKVSAMKSRLHALILWASLLCCLPALAVEQDLLQVFLQGSSSDEMRDLVGQTGGSITHELHIINAVGAKLSPKQLKAVLKSPLVIRYIDDLSDTERPENTPDEDVDCRVRGHIELEMTSQGFRWPLYNKKSVPASMRKLELEWPATLGAVKAITIGDTVVDPALYRNVAANALKIDFPSTSRPVVKDRADLKVSFQSLSDVTAIEPLRQRDFTINAEFVGDCSTDLVPGYENNHEDFYYNTVAGIDALHLQGVTGKGVTVAVVDSGLWEHDALTEDTAGVSRLVARYDALTDKADREVVDESGHGTHMASIIANSSKTTKDGKSTGTYKGVAPDARLVAVKVLDKEGLAHVLEIVRAVQWVVDNREKYDIRVLNLSFSQKPRWPYSEDPVNQAVMRAWEEGIAVVAAAGNDGPEPETIGSPGNLPYIITVGAVTDSWTPNTRDDDYIPDFSSRGPTPSGHIKPDVVALGGHMTGLIHPDSAIALEQPEDILKTGEFVSTGSSQASALVSGILALLIQLEPDLSPDDLKCKLITSAEPAINRNGKLAYSPFEQGHGYVTANRAVTLGERGCGNLEFDLRADLENLGPIYGPAIIAEDGGPSLPGLSPMVSSAPSKQGMSKTRKWGVKDHIERLDIDAADNELVSKSPIDWLEIYFHERATIENLSRQTHEPSGPHQ